MTYKAFLSYSHKADAPLAEAFQASLHRFATPWYRFPTIRVFRDKESLSANHALWPAIEKALSESEYFLLMASPPSAASPWVNREIDWWLENRSSDRILILLTEGEIEWLENDFDWERTTALPKALSGKFEYLPLYVDLRWAREEENLSLRHLRFRSAVLDIAAPFHGKPKEMLDSQDVRQHRRARRLMRSGVALLIGLLFLMTFLALYAFDKSLDAQLGEIIAEDQRHRAEAQRKRAEIEQKRAEENENEAVEQKGRADKEAASAKFQAMIATREAQRADEQAALATREAQRANARAREAISRRLAGEADRFAEARIDTALLLMAQAHRMADNTAVRSSWWRLLRNPFMPRTFLPLEAKNLWFESDGSLEVRLERESVTFRESEGVWRSAGRPTSPHEAASADTRNLETWQWSGSCAEESPVCICSDFESRFIGSYGDQDEFCISSELKVPGWCSEQPFQVPGVEVEIRREGPSVYIKTDLGSGEFACLDLPSAGEPGGPRPTLVAGDLHFFTGQAYADRIAPLGPPAERFAQSHDSRWLAVLRSGGGIEVWPGERTASAASRWGSTPLGPPAPVSAVAVAPSGGAIAVATASKDREPGGLVLLRSPAVSHISLPPGKSIRPDSALALSQDGALLAADVHVDLFVWRTSELTHPFQKFYLGRNRAVSIDFSGDGKHLVVTLQPLDGALPFVAVFSVERGEQEVGPFGIGVREAAFHPTDSDTIVTAGNNGVQLWSLSRAKVLRDLLQGAVVALAVDRARGRIAASLADGSMAVWDVKHGGPPVHSGKRLGKGTGTAFLPAADALLRASDQSLEAWYWLENTWLRIGDTAHLDAAALRDGSVLGLTSEGQTLVYDLDPVRWLDQTCQVVGRNLNSLEWNAHIGEAFSYECTCPGYGPGAGWPETACLSRETARTSLPANARTGRP